MRRSEFRLRVQTLVTPEEFRKNEHLLEVVDDLHFRDFMNCLKFKSNIANACTALDKIVEVSKKLAVSTEEVLETLPLFRAVILNLDSKSDDVKSTVQVSDTTMLNNVT